MVPHGRLQAQIDAKRQAAEQTRQRELKQDAAAKRRAAQYEVAMTARLLQAQPALTQNYGHKKSQLF